MITDGTLLGIRGFLIDTPERGRLRARRDGAMIVEDGLIAEIGDYDALAQKPRSQEVRWTHSKHVAVFPGLIDLHSHVPQYSASAHGEASLLPWLHERILPLERDFTGIRAKREAAQFFHELARHGTTTAMLYTATYEDSCEAAFEAAAKLGLRVIMGLTLMDAASNGDQPAKPAEASLAASERLCKKWHRAGNGLLDYAFSPRFALSCTEELMRVSAALARQYSAYIQTHLAENAGEIDAVRNHFPSSKDYTDVYEQCGLLGSRSVLGHCVHLSEREREAIAAAGASVAHCPTANFFLRSGIMPLGRFLSAGIRVGLGTDVGAGPELNLWQVMRSTIEAQKARSFYESDVAVPTPADALYLATQGAADALGKGAAIGSLEIGKEADLTVVDYHALLPYRKAAKSADLKAEDVLSLCIYRGGPQAVVETLVRGKSVYRSLQPELF